jgi:sterol desaturase/sphingolipid hydroxylase (fatty acid hydroxylase superfamily)
VVLTGSTIAGGYNPEVAAVIMAIVTGLWIWAWEFIIPYRTQCKKSDSDIGTDAIHLTVSGVLTKFIKPFYIFLLLPVVGFLASRFGSNELWPHHWNLLAQLALVLVLCEFGRYWFHRFSHNVSWLCAFMRYTIALTNYTG